MKTTRKSLTDKIKAVALATGLSVLPAKEVNSGISYGGSVGVDFNGNVSIGGQILSVNKPNSVYGKLGVNWVVMGKDKNSPSIRGGVGYLFDKGFSLGVEGGYNPKSESPFSLGIGGGYGVVKDEKNGGGENGNGGAGRRWCGALPRDRGGTWIDEGGLCEERCIATGGIWGDEIDEYGTKCDCLSEETGKGLRVDGTCSTPN